MGDFNLVAIILCVIVFIFNVYLLVNYQHPDDKNRPTSPNSSLFWSSPSPGFPRVWGSLSLSLSLFLSLSSLLVKNPKVLSAHRPTLEDLWNPVVAGDSPIQYAISNDVDTTFFLLSISLLLLSHLGCFLLLKVTENGENPKLDSTATEEVYGLEEKMGTQKISVSDHKWLSLHSR